jgi:thiamine-phosphate pyrophosphorylase
MRLIVITRSDFPVREARQIVQLFDNGLEILHLRKPEASLRACEHLLQQIPEKYYRRIKLHQHFDLVGRYSLLGVHCNSRYASKGEDWTGFHVSKSCHSLSELEEADGFDYLFLSPVFDSISKQGYRSAFSDELLCQARNQNRIHEKIVALGGVCADNLPLLKRYGFGAAAVLGAVWQAGDPLKAFNTLHKQIG